MREETAQKRMLRRMIAETLGLPPGQVRDMASHQDVVGREVQASRLPLATNEMPFQDASGNLLFTLDLDPLDGGLPLG